MANVDIAAIVNEVRDHDFPKPDAEPITVRSVISDIFEKMDEHSASTDWPRGLYVHVTKLGSKDYWGYAHFEETVKGAIEAKAKLDGWTNVEFNIDTINQTVEITLYAPIFRPLQS